MTDERTEKAEAVPTHAEIEQFRPEQFDPRDLDNVEIEVLINEINVARRNGEPHKAGKFYDELHDVLRERNTDDG